MRKGRHMKPTPTNNLRRATAALAAATLACSPAAAWADTGVDISHHNGCVTRSDALKAKADGASFGIVKATEGNGYQDPQYECSINGINGVLRRGVYHFARPDLGNSAEAEADWFLARTASLRDQGVIPVLDWEPGLSRLGLDNKYSRDVQWALRWLKRVEQVWGVQPLIYMSAGTIRIADWTPVASAGYDLWVAGYPRGYQAETLRNPGKVPYDLGPWKYAAVWQYSDSGIVDGIGQSVDVNFLYGDAGTWAKYAGGTDSIPETPAPAPEPERPAIPRITVDGYVGPETVRRWQEIMGTPVDGVITGQVRPRGYHRLNLTSVRYDPRARGSALVRAVQQRLRDAGYRVTVDGLLGPDTITCLHKYLGVATGGMRPWGNLGPGLATAIQQRLNEGRF